MSGKKQERMEQKAAVEAGQRGVLFRRRVATVCYLLALALTVIGAEFGPWWQTWLGDKQIGSAVTGRTFLSHELVALDEAPNPNEPFAKYKRKRVARSPFLVPAHLTTMLCMLAFLIASYNLVADTNVQWPVFLLTLGVTITMGYVVYRVFQDNRLLEETFAPVESAVKSGEKSSELRWLPQWGYALCVTASGAMFVASTYLTFVANRARKPQ